MDSEADAAQTHDLAAAAASVLPALDRFLDGRDGDAPPPWTALVKEDLPRQGMGAADVLEQLRDVLIPNGLPLGASGFSGWVTTAPTVVPSLAALSALLASPQRFWIQPFHELEAVGLRWLKELFGLSGEFQGLFTSGGSVANLVALGSARQLAGERMGIDASRQGIAAIPAPRIYASSEVHHVVHRAAGVLGLGRESTIAIPTDERLRMDASQLAKRIRADRADGCTPIAVVATAGTVNTGAVDPMEAIAEICADEQVWLHVDGAYGLPAVLDPTVRDLFQGFERADSIAVDPHKWLTVPIGCGAVFVRDEGLLGRAFTMEPADYLDRPGTAALPEGRSPFRDVGAPYFHYGVEQTAPARGVTVWAALREIGVEGFRDRVVRHNQFARHLADRVRASAQLELVEPPVLSICCFRYVPDAMRGPGADVHAINVLNEAILQRLHEDGRVIPSGTMVRGSFAIRACYINPRTTLADVDLLADEVLRHGAIVARDFS